QRSSPDPSQENSSGPIVIASQQAADDAWSDLARSVRTTNGSLDPTLASPARDHPTERAQAALASPAAHEVACADHAGSVCAPQASSETSPRDGEDAGVADTANANAVVAADLRLHPP